MVSRRNEPRSDGNPSTQLHVDTMPQSVVPKSRSDLRRTLCGDAPGVTLVFGVRRFRCFSL